MRKWIGLLVVSCLASAPAQAGWSFKQSMHVTGVRGTGAIDTVTHVRIEGDEARIDFVKGMDNPMFGRGGYMLLRGVAPKGMFIVNPEKKTYSKFDAAGLSQAMSPMMSGGGQGGPGGPGGPGQGAPEGGGFEMKISDAKLEKMLEEPGGEVLGRPTTHVRYKKSYVLTMVITGAMKVEVPTLHEIVEDLWLASGMTFGGARLEKVMASLGGGFSSPEMDKLAKLEREKGAKGFPLKSVVVDHSTPQGKGMVAKMMGGKEQTTTTTMEVSELEEAALSADLFAFPAGYTETQMMQTGAPAPDLEDEE
jgi:hypothetical protein